MKQIEDILNEKRNLNKKFSKHVERKRKEDAEEIDQEKNMTVKFHVELLIFRDDFFENFSGSCKRK